MKIIVDAMGGDNAPQAIVQGALDAKKLHDVDIILVGRVEEILKAVETCGEKELPAGVEIRDARFATILPLRLKRKKILPSPWA